MPYNSFMPNYNPYMQQYQQMLQPQVQPQAQTQQSKAMLICVSNSPSWKKAGKNWAKK